MEKIVSQPRRRGRPAKGEVAWREAVPDAVDPERRIARWWAHVRYADGVRRWVELDPAIAREDRDAACVMALEAQALVRDARFGLLPARAPDGETVAQWFERYLAWRTAQGFLTVDETKSRVTRRVLPLLGPLVARTFTRGDVEDVRDGLDRDVAADAISWKTAFHTWSDLRCMCKAMVNSKDRALRTREDDPSHGVLPPNRGSDKAKVILFPDEVAALLGSDDVPFGYRVVYAIAIYAGLRAGEQEALLVRDVDLAHGFLHIDKAVSRKTGKVGPTKHEHVGDVPIEPALAPLLEAITKGRAGGEALLWMPVDEDRAPSLRKHLRAAEVTRAALETHDERNKRLVFHDLRATHLTHRACRGDAAALIQAVARHESFQTTLGYINRATLLRNIGPAVFATLPPSLIEGAAAFCRILSKRPWDARRNRATHPAFWLATPMGIEVAPTTSPDVVCERDQTRTDVGSGLETTTGDVERGGHGHKSGQKLPGVASYDVQALKELHKLAVDRGDLELATTLLEAIKRATRPSAPVIALEPRRGRR